jgi:cytochrome c oxidase cbb3-type subunit 1
LIINSLSFCGMSTLSPMMSIKTVSTLSHYTDWTLYVRSGALGAGRDRHVPDPRLFGEADVQHGWSKVHFWTATIGIVIYIAAMWIAGVMQKGVDVARGQRTR